MLLHAIAVLLLGAAPADSTHRVTTVATVSASRPPQPRGALETWEVDASRSQIAFRVRQFISKIRGSFGEWSGVVHVDPRDWATAQVGIDIRTASIDTRNARRDEQLRSPELFAADSFPTITFRSTHVERHGADRLQLEGLLTLHGVTRPVTLEGTILGVRRDGRGVQRAIIAANGVINRADYGVTLSRVVEGSQVLGDDVELEILLELVRKEEVAAR